MVAVSSARSPERARPAGSGGEDDVIGLNIPIGVEDVARGLRGAACNAGDIRPDAMPVSLMLMAGLAVLGEDGFATPRVAGSLSAARSGLARPSAGAANFASTAVAASQRSIGELRESLSRRGVELAGGDDLTLEGLDERFGQRGRAGQCSQEFAPVTA